MAQTTGVTSILTGGGVVLGIDVISQNFSTIPRPAPGAIALYVTQVGGGSGFIAATPAQLAQYPDCIKIAQLPTGDPFWADVLDYEAGAADDQEVGPWAKGALAAFRADSHPGQRSPAIYVSANNVTHVVNLLIAAGVTEGIGLIIANWNLTEPQAQADVIAAAGPFPIVGIQYRDPGPYDLDVWDRNWFLTRSGQVQPKGYGAPLDLVAVGGDHSVKLTWKPPGTPGLPDPSEYIVFVYRGPATRSSLVKTYPRTEPSALTEQVGSLDPNTNYTAHVVAAGKDGTDVRPYTYASVTFTTA